MPRTVRRANPCVEFHTGSSFTVPVPGFLAALLLLLSCQILVAQNQPQGFLSAPAGVNTYTPFAASTRVVVPLGGAWNVSDDDGDSWTPLQIPSSQNTNGTMMFRRQFQIPTQNLGKYRWKLICFGMQYESTIRINDQFIGQHESSMPFTIDLPDGTKLGATNTIVVETSNRLDYGSTVPIRKLLFGSRTYGGIIRDVYLVGVPKVWIDGVRYQTLSAGKDMFEVRFNVRAVAELIRGMGTSAADTSGRTSPAGTITSEKADFELSVTLRSGAQANDSSGRGAGGEVGRGTQAFTIESKRTVNTTVTVPVTSPSLWSPQTPVLYDAVVQIRYQGALVDEQVVKVGFRTVSTQGTSVLLNGSPIEVKGLCYIEDSKICGASLSLEAMRRDMVMIRQDLGANLVRFPDGMPHPYLLQLCDELGIMVIVDAPVGAPSAGTLGDDVFRKRAMDRVHMVVEGAALHSSVIGYGLSAVIPDGNSRVLETVTQIRRAYDTLDKRLFCFAATSWTDPALRKLADVAGIVAFDVEPAQVRRLVAASQAQLAGTKPLVMLGYGKAVQIGNRNGYSDPLSYEAQAKYLTDVFDIITGAKMAGGVYWSFNDYRTDRPILTTNNDDGYVAGIGLTALDRQQRPGAAMLGALYTDQKGPELPMGNYSAPSPLLFVLTGIICAVGFLLLINNSRRFREDMTRSLLRPYNFYADIRDQRILSNLQTTLLGAVISVVLGIIVSSLFYHYRMNVQFDTILTAIISDSIKGLLDTIIWSPPLSIIFFSVLFFIALTISAGIIRAFSGLVRNRVFFTDAFAIAVWGALPTLLLTPVAIILDRLLAAPNAGPIAFAVMVAVGLWVFYRILRGTAVVFDVQPARVYLYTIGSVLAVTLVLFLTSKTVSGTFSYLREGISRMYGG